MVLLKLSIRNYAIIQQAELEFNRHLTIITGETGAGKSILLGALQLILGQRAEANVLFNKKEKCVVEAQFDLTGFEMKSFFVANELDEELITLVRREISVNGKSRAFINDTPVNLNVLKTFGSALVDLHEQQETLELNTTEFQLQLIDSLAKQADDVKYFSNQFYELQSLKRNLIQHIENNSKLLAEQDYLNFQFAELDDANLKQDEQQILEKELEFLNNANIIQEKLNEANQLISENDAAGIKTLKQSFQLLQQAGKFLAPANELSKRIESLWIELRDIQNELEDLLNTSTFDENKKQQVTERLDLIYRLQKKHRLNTIEELIALKNNLNEKLLSITLSNDEIEKLQKQIAETETELFKSAQKISAKRLKQIAPIEIAMNTMLQDVGMPNAKIKVVIEALDKNNLNEHGCNHVKILFAANKGSEFSEIKKVASGGERSRLMLCLKSLIAASTSLPTLIFDEIDTGISGPTAVKVSGILKQLSAQHQVISITHLPQIAGKADLHYYVYKQDEMERTITHVKKLTESERVLEIAKMLSGENPTAAAIENAKELIGLN